MINAGLSYILLHAWKCFRHAKEISVKDLHPAVEQAAKVLCEGKQCTMKQLARKVGLSTSRLSRLFREETGSTLVDFRNRQRIQRFQNVYEFDRGYTLLEAALEAGFGSYPQFHRVFRHVVGCSPHEYAQRTHA